MCGFFGHTKQWCKVGLEMEADSALAVDEDRVWRAGGERAAARAAAAAGTMRATMTCSCERDGMTAAAGFNTVFQWLGR